MLLPSHRFSNYLYAVKSPKAAISSLRYDRKAVTRFEIISKTLLRRLTNLNLKGNTEMFRKINLNADSMIRGFEKCARVRPLVVPDISTEKGASYLVRRSDGVSFALVMFARSPSGVAVGKCDCPAGEKDMCCYHVAAALLVHCGLVRAGLRVAVSRSFWERESGNLYKHSLLPRDSVAVA